MTVPLEKVVIDAGPTEDDVSRYPWKYTGYKDFTAWTSSDPDFFAVRRFDRLHTRAILTLQAQLVEKEEELDQLDKRFSFKNVKLSNIEPLKVVEVPTIDPWNEDKTLPFRHINNGTIRDDLPERAQLVADVISKLADYDKAVLNYASMHALGPAPTRNIQNIVTWFEDNRGAITQKERLFIEHQDELVSIRRHKSMLRQWFEDYIVFPTKKRLALFQRKPPPTMSVQDQNTVYLISDEAINFVASIAIFVTATAMLVLPLWILQTLQELRWKLAVITVFVVLCLAFLSIATLGRPFERLAATAGYAAVLVVFLQFGNTQLN